MENTLKYPDLVWKEREIRPAIEVSIDFLPEKYQGKWRAVVIEYTSHWIERNNFSKKATIWQWATLSVNLALRHPQHFGPSLSEFIVQFGLPGSFFAGLAAELKQKFENQCDITEHLAFQADDGWSAFCHVEQNKAWKEDDADIWVPASPAIAHEAPRTVVIPPAPICARPEPKTTKLKNSAEDAELMCIVRETFCDGVGRDRTNAIRDLARALGFARVGDLIRAKCDGMIRTAVRRDILANDAEGIRISTRKISSYDRDFLKVQFLASLEGRRWCDRDESIRNFVRWLGFRRTGHDLEKTALSLINGLIREGRLESSDDSIRRSG